MVTVKNIQKRLLLEARPRGIADIFAHRAIVHSHDGLGAITPDMAGSRVFRLLFGERLFGRSPGVHGFGPQMPAKFLVHRQPFNLSNVRRIRACAMGTL